jgi:3-oxoacyl-[acyl-carrier protein] reductase
MPTVGLYAGTKGAMEAMTRAFAADLGPKGITVNGVAPGATATEEFKQHTPLDKQNEAIENTALGRLGEPNDIAAVVSWLCSEDAAWVTAQIIDANGGLRRS